MKQQIGKILSHFYTQIALEVLKYIRFSTLYFCLILLYHPDTVVNN